jgi:hypothetical protein
MSGKVGDTGITTTLGEGQSGLTLAVLFRLQQAVGFALGDAAAAGHNF